MSPLARSLPFTVLLIFLSSAKSGAAELVPYMRDGAMGLAIKGIALPETLRKDLVSGLTSKILIRVGVLRESRTIAERAFVIDIKYDLWEETFGMTMTVDGTVTTTQKFSKIEETLAHLANFQLEGLFRPIDLQQDQQFVLKAEVLFNPIDRERMEKIRKWVAQNSTYASTEPGGFGSASPSVSPSAALFNRIFEQYVSGAEVASVWRETIFSQPLSEEDLRNTDSE